MARRLAQPPSLTIVRVGMAMWAHRPWYAAGASLPASKSGEELTSYSSVFGAVEGNTTFYALPAAETVSKWRDLTPPTFRFAFKLPQEMTHRSRLRNVDRDYLSFLALIEPLGERVGSITAQLPASFGPDAIPVLDAFLESASGDVHHSVELRHKAFLEDGPVRREMIDLLRRHRADWVHLDSRALFAGPCETPEDQEAFDQKPSLPVRPVATGERPIVRFIGSRDLALDETYFDKWIVKVVEWLDGGLDPTVFFHTSDNAEAPQLARRFVDAVKMARPATQFEPTGPTKTTSCQSLPLDGSD
jgi:uncharacterized protein YecE (DUF72 family)